MQATGLPPSATLRATAPRLMPAVRRLRRQREVMALARGNAGGEGQVRPGSQRQQRGITPVRETKRRCKGRRPIRVTPDALGPCAGRDPAAGQAARQGGGPAAAARRGAPPLGAKLHKRGDQSNDSRTEEEKQVSCVDYCGWSSITLYCMRHIWRNHKLYTRS